MRLVNPEQPRNRVSVSAELLEDQVRSRITGIVMSQVDAALMSAIDRYAAAYAHQAIQVQMASLPPTVVEQVAAMVDLEGMEAAVHSLVASRMDQILRAAGVESGGAPGEGASLTRAQQKVAGPSQAAEHVRFGSGFVANRDGGTGSSR